MKKLILIVLVIVVVIIGYFLISPVFKVTELDEESPLKVKDALDTMTDAKKTEFEKQTEVMKDKVIVMNDKMSNFPKLVLQGNFKPRDHEVEGKALLIEDNGKHILRFEDFETINGPALRIYLSSDLGTDDFVDLGPIKATKGNVNYDIPEGTDITKYKNVLVWCDPFSVLFSYSELS